MNAPLMKEQLGVRTVGPGAVLGQDVVLRDLQEHDQLLIKTTWACRVASSEAWVFCGDITVYRQLQSCMGVGVVGQAQAMNFLEARTEKRVEDLTKVVNGSNRRVYATKKWTVDEKARLAKIEELRRMRVDEDPTAKLINRPVSNIILSGNLVVLAHSAHVKKEDEISSVMQKVKAGFFGNTKSGELKKSTSLPSITANPLGPTIPTGLSFPAPPPNWKKPLSMSASEPEFVKTGGTFVTEEPEPITELRGKMRLDARPFEKLIAGKSFMCLSDDKEMKAAVKRTFLGSAAQLTFVKSSMECLHTLIDPRSRFNCVFLDLTKSGLNADSVVRTIRENERHADAPIIVFADQQGDLTELIRQTGSYVVFKPVVGRVMREAVVWCMRGNHRPPHGSEHAETNPISEVGHMTEDRAPLSPSPGATAVLVDAST
jgi:CheY-like chemotaxis protein